MEILKSVLHNVITLFLHRIPSKRVSCTRKLDTDVRNEALHSFKEKIVALMMFLCIDAFKK